MNAEQPLPCAIYRCARQPEMYLYLRAGLDPQALPEPLRRRTGLLTLVMNLELHAQRKLARAEVGKVMQSLHETGYYLQLPPQGQVEAHLYFGDGL